MFYRFSHTSDHLPSRREHCPFSHGFTEVRPQDETLRDANPMKIGMIKSHILSFNVSAYLLGNVAFLCVGCWPKADLPNEDMFRPTKVNL
jgi:hypothetical protein